MAREVLKVRPLELVKTKKIKSLGEGRALGAASLRVESAKFG